MPETETTQFNLTKKKQTLIMIPLLIAGFVAMLNETLLNVAFPQLMNSLNISLATVQWLATAYMLVIGISVPVIALLLETFTTRKMYMLSISIFIAGTLLCGLSVNFPMLLTCRILQGLGAGMLIPIMNFTILAIFPPQQRSKVIGTSILVMMVAPAIGPTLSGLVLQFLNWQWLFFLSLPLPAVGTFIAWHVLCNVSALTKPKIDILSIILSTIGFGGLILTISFFDSFSLGNIQLLATLLVSILSLLLFGKRQLKLEQPMLNIRLFAIPMFTLGTAILFINFMIPFSLNIILPTFLQETFSLSPFAAGLALMPGGIVCGILSPVSGQLFIKTGAKPLVISGFIVLGSSMFGLSHITPHTGIVSVIAFHIISFVGISLISTPIQTNTLNHVPAPNNAHGVGITNTLQQLAAAFGSSLFIGLMSAVQTRQLAQTINPTVLQQQNAVISGVNSAFNGALILVVVGLALSFFIKTKHTEQIPNQQL